MTNDTKNGARIRKSSGVFHRPPWNAIQYVMGYDTTIAMTVTIAEYCSDRAKNSPFWESASA